MNKPKLKNPHYLTPSKASAIANSEFHFLQKYLMRIESPTTDAMQRGSLFHEIFYSLIKADNSLEDAKLVLEPEKWPLKKETGLTIAEYKEKWFDERKKEKKIVYKESHKPVIEAMQIALELNDFFVEYRKLYKKRKIRFEVPLESDKFQLAGIIDILYYRIADIKTTSKEFSNASDFIKWNEKSLAVQQIFYERLAEINEMETEEPFLFHIIKLNYPYQVLNVKLDPAYVELVRKWFNLEVYPQWKALWKKIEDNYGKYPFERAEELGAKVLLWRKAQKQGIYNFSRIDLAEASGYFMGDMRKNIAKLERAEAEKLKRKRLDFVIREGQDD